MKRREFIELAGLGATSLLTSAGCSFMSRGETTISDAIYRGVKDYGSLSADDKDSFIHLFEVDNHEEQYTIAHDDAYALQNVLQEGYTFNLEVQDGVLVGVSSTDHALSMRAYEPPVMAEAGKKTLKNYLATALMPVGTALYVYGGGWNWQDSAASNQAMSLGVPQSWVDFFDAQDASYTYNNEADPAQSYYPNGGWNQYYYAGPDCSGYLGWLLYNVMETEDRTVSESEGYVMAARKMAHYCADQGWGSFTQDIAATDFKPGDIVSMASHVWTVIGTCADTSIVIAHSTPTDSKTGNPGGGVQLSALNPSSDTDTNCEAFELVRSYMSTHFPVWSSRYDAVLKPYSTYTEMSKETCGKFSWNLAGGLMSDPDGYAALGASDILRLLLDGSE